MPTVYDEVFEAWRREFHTSELQTLRPDLFKDTAAYVRRLKEAQRNLDQKSLKASILEDELLRLEKLVRQLVDHRLEKLRETVNRKEQPPIDTSEKWVLDELSGITRHVERFKEDLVRGRSPSVALDQKSDTVLVRFVKDIPSIIGVDLKTHGPFVREDIANLPFENAESLIRQGAAVEIRPRPQENG